MANQHERRGDPDPVQPLTSSDRVTVAMLIFFTAVAVTLEAYWLIFHNVMQSRTDIFARALAIYWPADSTYSVPGYGPQKAFVLALEGVNTLVSTWLNVLLIFAIRKQRPYRHPLQLTLATYTSYGTFLYFAVAHIGGYPQLDQRTAYPWFLFYLTNAPWLLGYGWMAFESFCAITRQFRTHAAAEPVSRLPRDGRL